MPGNSSASTVPAVSITIDECLLRAVVQEVVAQLLADRERLAALLPSDRLAFPESEAAMFLGMRSHQLRDERRRGRITPVRILGRRVFYTREELLRYLEKKETQ